MRCVLCSTMQAPTQNETGEAGDLKFEGNVHRQLQRLRSKKELLGNAVRLDKAYFEWAEEPVLGNVSETASAAIPGVSRN
ncbi:hypothetical protein Mapa_007105 [Marchantia paleacea]|nr:hypothetical protein Mapa_007105 [Marchantia paleacea]